MPGNELVLAKRLADETEAKEKRKRSKPVQLTQKEGLVLQAVSKNDGATVEEIVDYITQAPPIVSGPPITNPPTVLLLLIKLREKELVLEPEMPPDGTHRIWTASKKGLEYLVKKRLGK
jgi:hypothetical protein